MANECDILAEAAAYLGRWLGLQRAVKEESLTDWLLFDVSSKTPRIRCATFTRHQEARKTGADWEWWFLYPNGSFRWRVQAKKLDPVGDNYAALAYTNRYGLQIDRLIADATTVNAVPAYMFFTSTTNPRASRCGGNVTCSGAFSVGAQTIYQHFIASGKVVVTENQILGQSIPMQCFACCPLLRHCSMEPFLRNYFTTEMEELGNTNVDGILGFQPNIPNYVASLLEHPNGIPEWWEQEFAPAIQDFNSILIHDRREGTQTRRRLGTDHSRLRLALRSGEAHDLEGD